MDKILKIFIFAASVAPSVPSLSGIKCLKSFFCTILISSGCHVSASTSHERLHAWIIALLVK